MIKANIIKRIQEIEKQVLTDAIPDMIMIHYDWYSKDWIIDEKSNSVKSKHYKHYKDYVFHPKFNGTVILDLIDCPEEFIGNLHSIQMKAFRKSNHLENCAISLEAVHNDMGDILQQSFNVIIHEYV